MAESKVDQSGLDHDPSCSTGALFVEISRLTEINREDPDREVERRLLQLRHLAGIRLLGECEGAPAHPSPSSDLLGESVGLPDFAPDDVSPALLRAAILRDGCMIVRGLFDRVSAVGFAAEIARAFAERDAQAAGRNPVPGYYEEFQLEPGFRGPPRSWIREGGGMLAADSPKLAFEMIEMFITAGVPELVAGYLGEAAALSVHKTTLRKAEPRVVGAWHQDGAFMGEVRSLNLWVALSHCGDDAPGLDIVPSRLAALVPTGTDDAYLATQVSEAKAEEAAGGESVVRPIFEPGDAVIFDELCLHRTASSSSMTKERFAIESWFFGGSAFPPGYAPIAL